MSQPSIDITRERRGEVELVRIGQAPGRAGLDLAALEILGESLLELRRDREVRVVVMAVQGRALQGVIAEEDARQWRRPSPWQEARRVIELIEDLGRPVIGVLDGPTEGIGSEIALAGNWLIGTARTSFTETVASLGILEGSGWSSRLRRILGPSLALELLLTGRTLGSEEARQGGLLQELADSFAEAEKIGFRIASSICLGAPLSIKWAIETVRHGSRLPLPDGLRLESALFALSLATSDAREGIDSFREKRSPRFYGR